MYRNHAHRWAAAWTGILVPITLLFTAPAAAADYDVYEILPGHEVTVLDGGRFNAAAARSVVGWYRVTENRRHAFLWEIDWTGATEFTDLGVLEGGTWSEATGVCNELIVGRADTAEGETHGFVYWRGQMYDANDLVHPQFGSNEPPTIVELTGTATPGICTLVGCATYPGSSQPHGVLLWGMEPMNLHVVEIGRLPGAYDCVPMDIEGFAGAVGYSGGRAFHYGWNPLSHTPWSINDLSPNLKGSSGNAIMRLNTGDAVIAGCVGGNQPFSQHEGMLPQASLWWNGARFELPFAGAIASEATDVSYFSPSVDEFGVVGWFRPQGSSHHQATMWVIHPLGINVEQVNLHSFLDGMVESEAVMLGDFGDVAVNGYTGFAETDTGHAFLLVPR